MSVLQMPPAINALCYEHHIRMSPRRVDVKCWGLSTNVLAYACPEPGCNVHYNLLRGYFVVRGGLGIRQELVPAVLCPYDGLPMYLAEVRPERKSFRLWRCLECNACRSNGSQLLPAHDLWGA